VRRAAAFVIFLSAGCAGTTGEELVTFTATAAGPPDVQAPYAFTSGRGFEVTLTKAVLHVGALYLNQSMPVSGAQETNCVLPGTYVAEVTGGLDVDLLSATPQRFPVLGEGTTLPARVGEVWLTNGPINAAEDQAPILMIEGTFLRDDMTVAAFRGTLTIGKNRTVPASDPARPGSNPICKQRIVSPIPTDIAARAQGALLLRVDPKELFATVDFAVLAQVSAEPPLYGFYDAPRDQPSINLYQALHSTAPYRFSWTP
jgi:hypothetical protein